MRRRAVLGAMAALATPRLAPAQPARVLKFIPQGDLALLDPIQTPLFVTRHHALMVFDTLYGVDADWKAQPQMVEGHAVENDGRLWKLTLREGLKFHDGTPVLARDVVASLQRWGRRDSFGLALMATVDEIAAPSDRVVEFRLKKPFPLLPDALAKAGPNLAVVMPERLAKTDPFTQVTEMVGSGPYRFLPGERVPGARAAYARFEGYVPRPTGTPSGMSGPKLAHFDRVEWITIPDAATAAAALQSGEVDWWEQPTADFLPVLRRNPNLTVDVTDTSGLYAMIRFNFLNPPFDNPAVRRAALAAVSQADDGAVAGTDRAEQGPIASSTRIRRWAARPGSTRSAAIPRGPSACSARPAIAARRSPSWSPATIRQSTPRASSSPMPGPAPASTSTSRPSMPAPSPSAWPASSRWTRAAGTPSPTTRPGYRQ